MLSEYAQSVAGSTTVGVISLVVAFLAFVVIVVRVLRIDNSYLRRMSELPFDGETASAPHQEKAQS